MAHDEHISGKARPNALEILQTVYGYDAFRGAQAAIIDAVCQGSDALVLMPTGGGKSLCYQIPAMVRPGLGIVVSPLIALMHDQVRALSQLGVRAAFLNSTLAAYEQTDVMQRAQGGDLDLLYVAPERLLQDKTLAFLAACSTSVIAIDEAHCVSSWGHDFRQDYLGLGVLKEAFPDTPRMALTATADDRTRADIVARLALADPATFIAGFDRPNICYSVSLKTDAKRQLLSFLADHEGHSGIVYCLSRKSVESTAEFLYSQGLNAMPYHAGLSAEDATRAPGPFPDGRRGDHGRHHRLRHGHRQTRRALRRPPRPAQERRGVLPGDRARRARRRSRPTPGWCTDCRTSCALAHGGRAPRPTRQHKRLEREKLDALLGWCEVTTCRRRPLLAYFGDSSPSDCGNCDNCLKPPATWDGTEAAQQGALLRLSHRPALRRGHVVDVLRGSSNEKVQKFRHHTLSTFGIGKEFNEQQWRSVFRQLVVRGFLRSDPERFGGLVLTPESRPLLRGDVTLNLREDAQKKTRSRPSRVAVTLEIEDEEMFESLKALRAEIASEAGVPPYVVFHDATLVEMIQRRPATTGELLEISGIGQSKMQKYGEVFLAALNE